jgi:hypothetical protein
MVDPTLTVSELPRWIAEFKHQIEFLKRMRRGEPAERWMIAGEYAEAVLELERLAEAAA